MYRNALKGISPLWVQVPIRPHSSFATIAYLFGHVLLPADQSYQSLSYRHLQSTYHTTAAIQMSTADTLPDGRRHSVNLTISLRGLAGYIKYHTLDTAKLVTGGFPRFTHRSSRDQERYSHGQASIDVPDEGSAVERGRTMFSDRSAGLQRKSGRLTDEGKEKDPVTGGDETGTGEDD